MTMQQINSQLLQMP